MKIKTAMYVPLVLHETVSMAWESGAVDCKQQRRLVDVAQCVYSTGQTVISGCVRNICTLSPSSVAN